MSNNEQQRTNPFEIIKGIPDYLSSNVAPLQENVRDLKSKMQRAKEELSKKREELNNIKKEESNALKGITTPAYVENTSPVDVTTHTDAIADIVPSGNNVAEPRVDVKVESVVSDGNPATADASEPKAEPTKTQNKVYINNDVDRRPQRTFDNRPTYINNNSQGNTGSNNRPTYVNNNSQGNTGVYNNRPAYPNPQGNTSQGGYNNNRPPYVNNNPQGGGYNNNRPPYVNNNTQGGGFNNNRPNNSTFPPRVPRLPKADMAPPSPTANRLDNKKKKVGFEEPKKTQMNKRTLVRKGYVNEGDFDENGIAKHVKQRRMKKQSVFTPNTINIENAIVNSREVPIKTLAERIGKTAIEIVKKCMQLGQMHTINDIIDFDTAELIASEFKISLEYRPDVTAEDTLNAIVQDGDSAKRPPVVTIMGHVDHGKTSLLDYIRKTRVALGEAGGITQHIGAYTINVKGEQITFLDTPGHEAFTSMRMRGAKITDIAIIVIAADDGIMPQSIEAINHAKEAGVSVMVAINKIDKPGANIEKTMQQLTQHGIVPEAWGGDVMVNSVSAKTGQGIDELLESIILLAEVKELKAIKDCPAKGSVIEARLDKGIGPVATVLIQEGTLSVGDYVVAGTCTGKVRALIDDTGRRVKLAGPSHAVSVLGLSEVPNAGDSIVAVQDEKLAKEVAQERMSKEREFMQRTSTRKNLEDMFKGMSDGEMKSLGIIIKGDVQGSVEAVKQALVKLSDEMSESGVKITIIHSGVGAINESDIKLADSSSSIIIAFNVRPEPKARQLADRQKVDIKIYRVIYDAIDDVTKALKGMLDPIFREEIIGHAEVRETFRITDVGTIAGCYITDGKVQRNAKFRLLRENVVVFDGSISSMKRNKDEAKEVATGFECGIGLQNFNDIKVGDIIEAFLLKEEEQ